MRVHFLAPAFIFSLSLGCEFARADLYRDAVQAETEGIPEVSVTKLRQFLAGNPSGTEIDTAKLLLAKCLLQIRRPEEALTVLNDSSLSSAEARQLKAETLLRTRHWDEAARLFKEILDDAGSDNTRLGLAEAQLRKGESDQAMATLQPLLENRADPDARAVLMTAEIELNRANLEQATKLLTRLFGENATEQLQKQCLLGQIAFQAGKLDEAETAFNQVISASKGLTARLLAIAQLGLARVSIQQQEFDEAESVMVKAITDQARSIMLPELFETLYSVYALEQSPTLTPLIRWSQEDPQEVGADRPAFALYYLGKLQLRLDAKAKGETTLRRLINDYPTHRLAGLATVAVARLKIDQGAADQAVPLLTQWLANESNLRTTERVPVEETLADAYFREAKFSEAQELYFQLAGIDQSNRARFLYGAAICALRSGDRQHYEAAVRELNGSPDDQTLLGNLEIARATIEAKSGQTGADTTLKHFLANFPDHPQTP
jgi:predicted negative regulator of RcsB-dependent stress response